MSQLSQTSQLLHQIEQRGGLDRLIRHTCERLRAMARDQLRRFPVVGRWEETDDVLQNVLIRLTNALRTMQPRPTTSLHYYRLAARHLRWELLDLAARHNGACGFAANHDTDWKRDQAGQSLDQTPCPASGDEDLEQWTRFHKLVADLPPDLHDVVDLHFYHGMGFEEVAKRLGIEPDEARTRWARAVMRLEASAAD